MYKRLTNSLSERNPTAHLRADTGLMGQPTAAVVTSEKLSPMGNFLLTTTPPTNPPPWEQEVENQKPWVSQGTVSSGKVRDAFLPSVKTLVLVWKSSFDHVDEWHYKEILCKWPVRLRDLTLPFNTTSHFSWDKPKKVFCIYNQKKP